MLYLGDCLEVLPTLETASVDAVICDPPYGTTAAKWDVAIPQDVMWKLLKRVIKPKGAIVLFCSQPFTSQLITSNLQWFKYQWVWNKNRGNGHLVAKYRPLQQTEDVAIFGKGRITYNPIMQKRDKPRKFGKSPRPSELFNAQKFRDDYKGADYEYRYPTNLLNFPWANRSGLHPTQKPVELMEYLIRTYTNEGETVLDFTMGSGSTGVACMKAGRGFIGVEKNEVYFETAQRRIAEAHGQVA